MNRLWLVTALGAALGASCGDPTAGALSPLNLDRPVDIAFACYGGMRVTNGMAATPDQQLLTTAQPIASCDALSPPLNADPQVLPSGQEDLTGSTVGARKWYGFILQSAAGTVAVARWAAKPAEAFTGGDVEVLDADPLTPGKNAISVGEEPIAIATDKSGCYEVTANAGSCDLSVLDINTALDDIPIPGIALAGQQATPVRIDRLDVKNAAGSPIRAKPAAMVAEPNTTVVGNTCGPTASGLVYIAYPGCHLVAAVDTSTGTIVSGVKYDAQGVPTLTDGNVTCPAECTDGLTMPTSDPNAGAPRPMALDLKFDRRMNVNTKRLVIGSDHLAAVTLVELDPVTSLPVLPQVPARIPLEDKSGTLGLTAVALSPQIGMGGVSGDFNDDVSPGGQGQYVYAVATDNTVRVVDVLSLRKECDTQVDTRFVRGIRNVQQLQCFPVGDPATPPRRSGAKGPGIELTSAGVPTSVTFVKAPPIPANQAAPAPTVLLGYFAIITASNGQAFVVNVDDDNNLSDTFDRGTPQSTAPTLIMAHQLRDSIAGRDAIAGASVVTTNPDGTTTTTTVPLCNAFAATPTTFGGGPHVTTAPVNNVVAVSTGVMGSPVSSAKARELPSLRQVECISSGPSGDAPNGVPVSELQLTASSSVRDQVFPDLRSLFNDESWTLTWEGALSQDISITAVDGPPIREAQMFVDSTASSRIIDKTRPFCEVGVEPFDILQMRGCNPLNGDADCPVGYQCFVHPDSSVTVGNTPVGACMLRTEASRLANACRDFLISLRRYTIGHADGDTLVILPRKHVLRTTPLDGCTEANNDKQCQDLANYAAQNGNAAVGPAAATPNLWVCRADDTRAPVNADPAKNKRCIQTCNFHSKESDNKDRDVDCDAGSICQGAAPGQPGTCMEGVMPPQACVNGPQRFDLHASEAFTVIGSRSGYVHPIIDKGDPAHTCGPDPLASPLQIGRLPLKAPACDPTADPITGKLPSGGFEANPCSLAAPQVESPVYQPGTCNPADPQQPVMTRLAPAIKFRNRGMTLTVVDPYYPGDKTCVDDGQGAYTTDRVPLVYPGYQLAFRQTSGYTPLTLSTSSTLFNPVFPVKVVAGPTNSIWVLDDGDYLSTSIGLPSTRGQVYRIEASYLGVVNLLQ